MQALATQSEWSKHVRDPAWMPHIYDANRDTLVFAYLPRDDQRRLTFLDPRFVDPQRHSAPVSISALPIEHINEHAGPLHFISTPVSVAPRCLRARSTFQDCPWV